MANSIDWDQLPDVSLVEVYLNLKDTDRLNMACTCKNWNRLFSSSVLWRERTVEFNSLAAERTAEKEIRFLSKHGHHLNKLKLGFGQPSFRSCAVISKAAENYLKRLTIRNDIHLKTIDLENLHMEQHWHFILSRNRLITALCRMLRKQRFLETVYLSGARMRIFDACRILESLAKGPTVSTIKSLYIEDLFETNVYPIRQPRYVSAMSRFLRLESVHLNYKYLNDLVLRNFGRRLSKTLQYLSVILEGDVRGIEIPSHCWEELKEYCPILKVGICLCTTILRGNDLRTPFVRGMPISDVYLTSWARIDDTEQRLAALLRHFGNTYRSTLECLGLCFTRHQRIDDELLYMLEKCTRINDLSIECRISPDTVIAICKLHYDKKLKLTSVNIVVPHLEDEDWNYINSYSERYLAGIPRDSVNIGPNDVGGSSSSSSSTVVDDDSEDGFAGRADPVEDDGEFEVEIRLNFLDQDEGRYLM